MPYEWKVAPEELFVERYRQMVSSGLPAEDVDAVRSAVTEMWPDRPGGWVHEWSRLAAGYAEGKRHQLAALAYGWAKFPTLANDARRTALQRQLEQYLLAVPGFQVAFERRVLQAPHGSGTTPVPVHLLTPPAWAGGTPVMLASGGVDTWKMDFHGLFEAIALRTGMPVLAFDIPGTGESELPMTSEGGADVVRALAAEARTLGNGRALLRPCGSGGGCRRRGGARRPGRGGLRAEPELRLRHGRNRLQCARLRPRSERRRTGGELAFVQPARAARPRRQRTHARDQRRGRRARSPARHPCLPGSPGHGRPSAAGHRTLRGLQDAPGSPAAVRVDRSAAIALTARTSGCGVLALGRCPRSRSRL